MLHSTATFKYNQRNILQAFSVRFKGHILIRTEFRVEYGDAHWKRKPLSNISLEFCGNFIITTIGAKDTPPLKMFPKVFPLTNMESAKP